MRSIYLNEHFFDFVKDAQYFRSNDAVQQLDQQQHIIGLAFYEFRCDHIIKTIDIARPKTQKLLVYIKEPLTEELTALLHHYQHDDIKFFGDAVLNFDYANWQTAISWFVSPRHYYQMDDWAKDLLARVDLELQDKPFSFDCLLGREKPHRDFVSACWHLSDLKDHFIYSYFRDDINKGLWDIDIGNLTQTWQSIRVFQDYDVALSSLMPYNIYNQSYHSIVAETNFFNRFTHLTEKTAKPIMAQRVFVAFAGQHYLRSLRRLGFETFSDVIDESYDVEPNHVKRLTMAWREVEKLCGENPRLVRAKVEEILKHNQNHFLTTDWHQSVKDYLAN